MAKEESAGFGGSLCFDPTAERGDYFTDGCEDCGFTAGETGSGNGGKRGLDVGYPLLSRLRAF